MRNKLLSTLLARRGLALDHAVLVDPARRLLRRRRRLLPGQGQAARTLSRLDEVLDDLERTLAAA